MDDQSKLSLRAEIKSANDVIKKLETFTKELEKPLNDNILTHLCDGLQTFLGYDVNSKGYDGSGIVYSDLDRLCDAVMGFLSGVLEAVKDEDEVITYDKYISGDKIDIVISKLQSQIGTGRAGLVESVDAVREWLEGYELEYSKKASNVTEFLGELKTKIAGKYTHDVAGAAGEKLETQLTNWKTTLQHIEQDLNNTENLYVNMLDSALKRDVMREIKDVRNTLWLFRESAGKEDFKRQVKVVDDTLEAEKKKLDEVINKESATVQKVLDNESDNVINIVNKDFVELQKTLGEDYDNLFKVISVITEKRKTGIRTIRGSIEFAKTKVNNELGAAGAARNNITLRLENIKNMLQKVDRNNGPGKLSSHLRHQVNEITSELLAVGRTLQGHVADLASRIERADTLRKETQNKAEAALNIVKGNKDDQKLKDGITKAADALKAKTTSLKSTYEDVKGRVEKTKSAAMETLGGLDKLIKKDLKILEESIDQAIKGSVTDLIRRVITAARKTGGTGWGGEFKGVGELKKLLDDTQLKDLVSTISSTGKTPVEYALEEFLYWLKKKYDLNGGDAKDADTLSITGALAKEIQDDVKSEALTEYFTENGDDFDSSVMINYTGTEGGMTDLNSGTGKKKLKNQLDKLIFPELKVENGHNTKLQLANDKDVETEITKLHSGITSSLTAFTEALQNLLDNHSTDDGMLQKLESLDGIIGHHQKEAGSLGDVHKKLRTLHNDEITKRGKIQAAIDETLKTVEELETVPSNIDDIKVEVNNCLNTLRKELIDHLDATDLALSQANDGLQHEIKAVYDAVGSAKRIATQAMEAIKVALADAVRRAFNSGQNAVKVLQETLIYNNKKAFDELTTQVRSLFSEQKLADLSALQTLLTRQLREITHIFDNDQVTGVKGVLARMRDDFAAPLNTFLTSQTPEPRKLANLAKVLNQYFAKLLTNLQKQTDFRFDHQNLETFKSSLTTLLTGLATSQHFDHNFTNNLNSLTTTLAQTVPHKFGERSTPLLQTLKDGIEALADQLNHAYVNSYSGLTVEWSKTIGGKTQLTDDADRCAKVFITCVYTWYESIGTMMNNGASDWISEQINATTQLGKWLDKHGYCVSKEATGELGELRNCKKMRGRNILEKLKEGDKLFNKYNVGTLKNIYGHLQDYYTVCHVTPPARPRTPCNVHDMLVWLTGLPHTAVYDEITFSVFSGLFEKPETDAIELEGDTISHENLNANSLAAYPRDITVAKLTDALGEVCHYSYDILTTIVGHGDEYTFYACQYCDNSFKFSYPSDPAACFDLLIAILRSLLPVFRFMYKQCRLETEYHGWSQCTYGNGIQSSCWQCGQHSTVHPSPSHTCSDTSPLHLYLTDGLKGMLPHQVTSVGCSSKCNTCPKNPPGMPCLTPLGFTTFSGSKKTGKDISNVLGKFLGNTHTAALFCLQPKPPSTLPEHFGFVMSLVNGWKGIGVHQVRHALETSIKDVSINQYEPASKLTDTLLNAYSNSQNYDTKNHADKSHEAKNHDAKNADISTLTRATACSGLYAHCGPYLYSLCSDFYGYIPNTHADLYLSWAIYLPWKFHVYLKSLMEAFQQISCQNWGCNKCQHGNKCKPGSHGTDLSCNCRALVGCRGVSPVFYQSGFTFGDAKTLMQGGSRKLCRDFCSQLTKVLHSDYFSAVFEECDKFLLKIRFPFMTLTLALWSLSLFYLICVMVGRLDVLHIRSHLRIPSSHKIAAQSLLAATQVGRLAKISYLQP